MEIRKHHSGDRVFIKSYSTNSLFHYNIWEYSMNNGDGTYTQIFMVEGIFDYNGDIFGHYVYSDYKLADKMARNFCNMEDA